MSAAMSSRGATAGRTSKPVISEMSSTARTLPGSHIATSSVRSSMNLDRDRAVARGRARGQQVGGRHVDVEDAEVDLVDAEALGDDARELVGRQDAALDEHLAGAPAVRARLRDRGLDRLARSA